MSTGFNSSFPVGKPLHTFQNRQRLCSNKKTGFRSIKESARATTRVRAHIANTMLLQVDVPPPPVTNDRPCLDRCLRTRYLPTQIPFSALPCAAYLSAKDVKQIAEVFKSFSVLPDASRSNGNRYNGVNSSLSLREHLVDLFSPTSDKDLPRNTQATEPSVYLDQRPDGGPAQSAHRNGIAAENPEMERPLKGTLPDDLAISKEWLLELLLAAMARNYSNEQMKHLSLNRTTSISSKTGNGGLQFHHTGKFDSGGLDGLQGSYPFLPIGVLPNGGIPGDNSPFGLTTSKDVSASLLFHKMRRFQQKQAVLTHFKRDLLRWIEPLLFILDPVHNPGINERCKEQVDKLHFFHQLMRSRRVQMDESIGLLSMTSTMPHATLVGEGVLMRSEKQEDEDGRVLTRALLSTRACDPVSSGTHQSQTPLYEASFLNYPNLRRASAKTSVPDELTGTSCSSRRSSVVMLEGSLCSSKLSISGHLKGLSNTGSYATNNTSVYINRNPGELALSHQGHDFPASRTVKELNAAVFVRDDDCMDSEISAQLIYYGEQPDGAMSQTFNHILANTKHWEQFVQKWERKADLLSSLSESTNCSSNGAPLRRNNNRQRAVVTWRDFSNNLILPADCLPANTLKNTNVCSTEAKNSNTLGNDFPGRYLCNDSTTARARGEAVYKRVLRVRLEGGVHGARGRHAHDDSFLIGDNDRNNEDDDIDQERDLKTDDVPWGHAQMRRRTDRAPYATTGPGRGFIAASNSAKGVASAAAAESEALAEELKGLHTQSADHVLVSTVHHRLVTSAKDGLLKLWDSDWGNFVGNFLNVGTSWVLHMQFLHNEQYLFIATSNAELTVVEFPSGAVLQKYRGCTTRVTALHTVVQPDLNGTRCFGLKPGECGPHRFVYRSGMTAKIFNSRLKESRQVKSETKYNAIPIEGFVSPTAVFLDPKTLICVFGSAEGTVGGFDLSQYLKSSSILASMNRNEQIPFFDKVRAHDPNIPVMGLCYNHVFQYVVSCGRDGSVSHIPLNEVLNIEGSASITRIFQRQLEVPSSHCFFGDTTSSITSNRHVQLVAFSIPARLVATVHSDRRILLWGMGRNTVDLVHRFSQETYDILSVSFMPKDHLIAVLTADLVISVYDFKGFRPLSVIHVTKCDECSVEDVSLMAMRCPSDDADGCVVFFPGAKGRLVCALRGPVLFDRSENESHEELSADSKVKVLPTPLKPEQPEPKPGSVIPWTPQPPPATLPTSLSSQRKKHTQQKPRKNITHHGAIIDVLLRRVHQGSSTTGTESGVGDNGLSPSWFELHTFSADCWRVWDPLRGELLREVNLCAEIRKQLPMFRRPFVTVCDWSTDACTRIIAGSRGGQVITLDSTTGAVNNVDEVLVAQRPLCDSKKFVDRFHDTQANRSGHRKKSAASTLLPTYKPPVSETLDTDKQTSTQQPILDAGSLFNLDATVVYHYGMHMLVCGSNRCVLRRYFTNDVDPSGEEQFIAMSFHLPPTARTTITACCIVRDTHICLGTMDTRLFFYRMIDGSEPYAEEPLRSDVGVSDNVGDSEPEIGAVIGLFFLNSSNQNLFVIVLDTGVVHVYSYLTNRSVARLRLHRAHECRIRKVIYHNDDVQLLICGDSLGRVRVLDISEFKSSTVDFASAMKERCVFQGAPEEVSSLAFFSLPTARFHDAPVKNKSLSGGMLRNGAFQRRSTTGSCLAARSAREGDQVDSENSQASSITRIMGRAVPSVNSSLGKPVLLDSRHAGSGSQADFIVVGAVDGNVRLFSLQKQYERTRSLTRFSFRTSSSFDAAHTGTRRSSFARPSFGVNGSVESSVILTASPMLPSTSPPHDLESLVSRRRHHSLTSLAHVGIFGLYKWNVLNSETFQRDFASSSATEGDTILVSCKSSRSSFALASERQDERFLDHLLLQAKKNIEYSSYTASQPLQNALSIEDRAAGSLHVSKRKVVDHTTRTGNARRMILKPQGRVDRNMAATSSIPKRARQEEQRPRDFRRRVVSRREQKHLESILPRKDLVKGLLASVNADDLPTEIFHTNSKQLHRSQILNGNMVDWSLCELRPRRGLRKYERNALLKVYPVSWLRKIDVIPSTCKVQDHNEDGISRLISTESAFSSHCDLSAQAYCEGFNKDVDINANLMDFEKMFGKDVFFDNIKVASMESSQSFGEGMLSVVDCSTSAGAMCSGDNNGSSSAERGKPSHESGAEAPSSFITDLENITVLKTPKLIKTDSPSVLSAVGLPALGSGNSFPSSPEGGHSTSPQANVQDAQSNLSVTQPLAPNILLQDSVEVSMVPNDCNSLPSPPLRSTGSASPSERTHPQRERYASTKNVPGGCLGSMNKPVFISERDATTFESSATSAFLLAETAPHTPKSFALNDSDRALVENRTSDGVHKDNALEAQIKTVLSNLSASAVEQRYDQTILAHLAQQLDRVRPSGYTPGAFMSRVKQVWQQRSIEDASQTMILRIANSALRCRGGSPRASAYPVARETKFSPIASGRLKGPSKAVTKHQCRSELLPVPNHAVAEQDPGIGLNLAILTLPTDKGSSIVYGSAKRASTASAFATAKDNIPNFDKTSTLPAHERVYQKLESWRRRREQEVLERRRVVERIMRRTADSKSPKHLSPMPNRLVHLPLLYAEQALEPVHVSTPSAVSRCSEDAGNY